jgi:hypothetical protein
MEEEFLEVLKEVSQRLVNYLGPYIEATYNIANCLFSIIGVEGISIFSVSLLGSPPYITMKLYIAGVHDFSLIYDGRVSEFREETLVGFHILVRSVLNLIPKYLEEDLIKYIKRIEHYEKKVILFNYLLEHFPEEEKE